MTDKQKELLAENLRLQKEIERISLRNQLKIPKSVADEIKEKDLDVYGITNSLPKQVVSVPEWFPFYDLSDVLIDWCEKNEKWWAIMDAYLAGKALGVDLVKVVEG